MNDKAVEAGAKDLRQRLLDEQAQRNLSLRQIEAETGISFSTIGRWLRGKGDIETETERLLKVWLGDDTKHMIPREVQLAAKELGRIAAREFLKSYAALPPAPVDEVMEDLDNAAWLIARMEYSIASEAIESARTRIRSLTKEPTP